LRGHASIFYGFSAQKHRETTGPADSPTSRAGKGIAADGSGPRDGIIRTIGGRDSAM